MPASRPWGHRIHTILNKSRHKSIYSYAHFLRRLIIPLWLQSDVAAIFLKASTHFALDGRGIVLFFVS